MQKKVSLIAEPGVNNWGHLGPRFIRGGSTNSESDPELSLDLPSAEKLWAEVPVPEQLIWVGTINAD